MVRYLQVASFGLNTALKSSSKMNQLAFENNVFDIRYRKILVTQLSISVSIRLEVIFIELKMQRITEKFILNSINGGCF